MADTAEKTEQANPPTVVIRPPSDEVKADVHVSVQIIEIDRYSLLEVYTVFLLYRIYSFVV